jgi:hypothetical protein
MKITYDPPPAPLELLARLTESTVEAVLVFLDGLLARLR